MTVYALAESKPETADENYWIAPNAIVIGQVRLETNASIWWNAVVRGDNDRIVIGANSNIQDGAVLHTDVGVPLVVGNHVTVGHLAMLHGCTIGDNSLIGIGAIILNRARIGRNCLIGAHALIPEGKEIPDGSFVLGSPGRIVKETTEAHRAGNTGSALHYVENWKRYKNSLMEIRR